MLKSKYFLLKSLSKVSNLKIGDFQELKPLREDFRRNAVSCCKNIPLTWPASTPP